MCNGQCRDNRCSTGRRFAGRGGGGGDHSFGGFAGCGDVLLVVVDRPVRRRGTVERIGLQIRDAVVELAVRPRPGTAREHLRVAHRLKELPAIRESFGHGELSYSKVRALTRCATESTEAELVEVARHATATHIERIAQGYRRAENAEAGNAARQELGRE